MSKKQLYVFIGAACAAIAVVILVVALTNGTGDAGYAPTAGEDEASLTAPAPTATYAVVNVQDYGAAGDGVTDDGPAILRATAELEQGAKLFFPSGSYYVATPASLPYNWPADWAGAPESDSFIKQYVAAPGGSGFQWQFVWIEPLR